MGKSSKIVSILLLVVLIATYLVGCSPSQSGDDVVTTAQEILSETKNKVIAVENSEVKLNDVTVPQQAMTDSMTELSVGVEGFSGNVYDYEEIDITGEFVDPDGNVTTVPGFWYKGYDISFEEYDLEQEYALDDWHGNAWGVFDAGDSENAGRGVVKVLPGAETQYICQKSVSIPFDRLSTWLFISIKKADDLPVDGYYLGLYSDTTGKSAYHKIDTQSLTDGWNRISINFDDFTKDEGAVLQEMTALKIFAYEDQVPEGALLIKDFGIEREGGKFPTLIDELSVDQFKLYNGNNDYNGYEILTRNEQDDGFRIRFNAKTAGDYTVRVSVRHNGELVSKYTTDFSVTANPNPSKGVIKVEETQRRNFVFSDDNSPYLAIGANQGWYTNEDKRSYEYVDNFQHYSETGMTWARIFLLESQFSLINIVDGVTNYESRMDAAYRLDKVLQSAEQNGVYIQLVFLVHGSFVIEPEESELNTWQGWNSNPFNVDCGGYLNEPWEFFTNERAKADFKKMVRYVIARYGYSDNIFAWELWNEVSHLADYMEKNEECTAWHIEMANFVKGIDSYDHMVTSSIGPPSGDDPQHAIKELDFANVHLYGAHNYSTVLLDNYIIPIWQNNNKPILMSEVGAGGENGEGSYIADPSYTYIKQSLYVGCFAGSGGGNAWWWDWIDKYNLYYLYQPVVNYFNTVTGNFATMPSIMNGDAYFTSENIADAVSQVNVRTVGYKDSHNVYAYTFDVNYNKSVLGSVYNNSTLTFGDMENGIYSVKLFDTETGTFTVLPDVVVTDGTITVSLGAQWQMDVAVCVEKR